MWSFYMTGTVYRVGDSSPANLIGDIGSGYPTNVYDSNRLLLPILRENISQSVV
jgi:hypothetical protein